MRPHSASFEQFAVANDADGYFPKLGSIWPQNGLLEAISDEQSVIPELMEAICKPLAGIGCKDVLHVTQPRFKGGLDLPISPRIGWGRARHCTSKAQSNTRHTARGKHQQHPPSKQLDAKTPPLRPWQQAGRAS